MDRVKLFIEKFAYPYMEKRMGNQIRGMLNELKKYESFTPQQLTALRKKKLEYLLTECIHSVPAYEPYKHLEEEIKNNPAAALKQFPVLTKDNFREGFYSYLNKGANAVALVENFTRGTTGEPVKFFMDRHMVGYYEAARWRGLSWWGITPGSRSVMIWGNPSDYEKYGSKTYRRREKLLKNRIMIPDIALKAEEMESHLRDIREFSPEYVYGYASALHLFSRLMLEQNLSLGLQLKAVVSTAEILHDHEREDIEKAFGCPVVNEYGARDGGIIAYQCREGSMHISAENVVLEVVDPVSLETLPRGESGALLVTDLNNYVMPRLRYRIGDRAALSEKFCPCGMGLPVLEKLEGREA